MTDNPTPSPESDKPQRITPDEAVSQIEALLGPADKPDDEEQPPKPPPEDDTPPDSPPPQQDEPGEQQAPSEEDDAAVEGEEAQASDDNSVIVETDDGQAWALPKELEPHVMMRKDYTQKTQELAAQRKELMGAAAALVEERQRYSQLLPQLEQLIQTSMGQEPDWTALAQHPDPAEYWRMKARWDEHQRQLSIVEQQKQNVQQLQQLDMMQKLQAHLVDAGRIMLEAIPSWKNEKQAAADKDALKAYALKSGFSEWEVNHAYDHRVLLWGHKARLYDQLMAQKPRPQQPRNGLRTLTPGAAINQGLSKVTKVTRAKQRVAKTRSVRDGEAAIEAIIERGL